MAKIDKINVQGTDYDIDVPVGDGTAGQVLTINDDGDGTEWKTPQGGGTQKYLHNILMSVSNAYDITLQISSDSNTQFTKNTLLEWLRDNGFNNSSNVYPCNWSSNRQDRLYACNNIYAYGLTGYAFINRRTITIDTETLTITDNTILSDWFGSGFTGTLTDTVIPL